MQHIHLAITATFAALCLPLGCMVEPSPSPDGDAEQAIAQAQAALHGPAMFDPTPHIPLDGDVYVLHGPQEETGRGMPGHTWIQLDERRFFGLHYNTGPFGMPRWWSSDAGDGQLLYLVFGEIDTWSPEKVESFRRRGFVHYHKLVTESGNQPHPNKLMWMKHIAVDHFTLDGGPRPWLAHEVEPGHDADFQNNTHFPYPPRERFLYVGCVDKGGEDPDFLAVIGADPTDPDTYSRVIHRVDMPGTGDELHHYGFNIFLKRMLVPGIFSSRLHILNIEDDPAHPYIESYHDDLTPDSGYIAPHTVIGLPNGGFLVTMLGSDSEDSGPGGIVELDPEGNVVGPFGPGADRDGATAPPMYMYDVGINRLRNRMVSTTFGLPDDIIPGITIEGLGDEVYVWDFKAREVLQVVDFGPNRGALEVRWMHEMGSTIGFTNAPGSSEIWRWHDLDLDGHYEFEVAIALPEGSVPTDILLSSDDRFLYVSNWMGNSVMQFDISDPFAPVLVSQVSIPNSQMMRLSPDNRRLYVTNSLLSTWDEDEFPAGVTRNQGYGMYLIDIDHVNGGMQVNEDFFVDFDAIQKQNTIGPARPHQVFFDPSVPRGFGAH